MTLKTLLALASFGTSLCTLERAIAQGSSETTGERAGSPRAESSGSAVSDDGTDSDVEVEADAAEDPDAGERASDDALESSDPDRDEIEAGPTPWPTEGEAQSDDSRSERPGAARTPVPKAVLSKPRGKQGIDPRVLAFDERLWRKRYDRARLLLIEGHDREAAEEFEELAELAPSPEDQRVAQEFASVARTRVGMQVRRLPTTKIRSTDELSILYTSAFIYGFGSSGWVALQVKPQTFPGAVLPFFALTTAAVGGVAIADSHRPLRLGVPQSISSGMYLGLGEGIWLTGYQHSRATRRDEDEHWDSETVSTVLWSGATLGALGGGLVGAYLEPTPGEVSFVASSALWTGVFSALFAPAVQPYSDRTSETAFLVGMVGYNVGMVGGVLLAPNVKPSIARVRFVDLGGLAGSLMGAGAYLLAAGNDAEPSTGLVASGLGLGAGLGLAWWATQGMDAAPAGEHSALGSLRPVAVPSAGGWTFGVAGAL